ncbi:MAG: polynucleotide adenylyltransferase PcnB [Pseudomonadales bacterium]|nr:polynucleotide adenylyltransferase PcnB [Pseudomonadales bacterium]
MLQRLKRLFRRKPPVPTGALRRIKASRHQLLPAVISPGAREIVATLTAAGYQALVVGGCIRDTLLGQQVKDFDVATNATPEQVRALFRRSRIIGRRFRIVHVHIGRELVEVTTFRAGHDGNPDAPASARHTERKRADHRGILLRDNVFGGTLEEDAQRRDFTINAIYYDLASGELLDFVGGMEDLGQRSLRVIGDPGTRFREDPVRMLRAARFQAKLGFELHPATAESLAQGRALLGEVPPARLFDELIKLLMTGHALAAYEALRQHHLLEQLLPDTAAAVAADECADRFLRQALINTDTRVATQQRVTPAFLFAALLWPPIAATIARPARATETAVLSEAAAEVIAKAVRRVAIPRRFSTAAREIWELQPRLEAPNRGTAEQLLEHPRFRAAYDFLLLREQSDEELGGMGAWWTRFQAASAATREAMVAELQATPKRRRRRRRAPAPAVE